MVFIDNFFFISRHHTLTKDQKWAFFFWINSIDMLNARLISMNFFSLLFLFVFLSVFFSFVFFVNGFKILQPNGGKFIAFDHITFYVGNAKQAASYYTTRLGFEPLAYQDLETGHRQFAKHVVKQNKVCPNLH